MEGLIFVVTVILWLVVASVVGFVAVVAWHAFAVRRLAKKMACQWGAAIEAYRVLRGW